MRLMFVRHGNTFEPGAVPYCAGSTEDLPLVEKGRQQAAQFGQALKDAGVVPTAWYAGPLVRHKQFSEIAIAASALTGKLTLAIDERLNELNYGSWSKLTDQQIKDKFGAQVHEDWSLHCVYPADAGWQPSPDQLRAQTTSFLADLTARYEDMDTVVAVSSGGRLRYFLEAAAAEEFAECCKQNTIKIATGHMCIFDYVSGSWSLVCWNAEPAVGLLTSQCLANT